MKNKEKYKDEIVEIACSGGRIALTKDTNKLVCCGNLPCRKCAFSISDDNTYSCNTYKKDWAEAEYKEPITLTEDEKVILKNLNSDYEWICRNERGWLSFSEEKPHKEEKTWESDGYDLDTDYFNHLFRFIKFEDEEPYNIDELLRMNGVER